MASQIAVISKTRAIMLRAMKMLPSALTVKAGIVFRTIMWVPQTQQKLSSPHEVQASLKTPNISFNRTILWSEVSSRIKSLQITMGSLRLKTQPANRSCPPQVALWVQEDIKCSILKSFLPWISIKRAQEITSKYLARKSRCNIYKVVSRWAQGPTFTNLRTNLTKAMPI